MNAIALVVGNANYSLEKDRLINSVNDAKDFSNKLLSLGFTTVTATDCSTESFDREIRQFGKDLENYDVGLFYFSGHGLQIEGKNYLTATDTNFTDDVSVKHSSIPLDEIIGYMQNANPIIKILILDACRDNPLSNVYRGANAQGLAPIHAPKGTLIAFSTSPGEKAMDYGSGRNSIYTGALLNHIDDTNIPIEDFFKRVRTSVYTLSSGKQTSWEHTSLIGNFYFNSGQLIHSIDLPYKNEHIADENFESNGSDFDEIIVGLKSHDFYTQNPALVKLRSISIDSIDDSSAFLLGRNILQTAIGGEFTANSIIKNLESWIQKYSIDTTNHVLNGILYEIYFDSKGQFRQNNFKSELIDNIYRLEENEKYKRSFEFIGKQLKPFSDFLIYKPELIPTSLAIEIQFNKEEIPWGTSTKIIHSLVSIKHQEIEYYEIPKDERGLEYLKYSDFVEKLRHQICLPKKRLRLSTNFKEENIKMAVMHWKLKLHKQ